MKNLPFFLLLCNCLFCQICLGQHTIITVDSVSVGSTDLKASNIDFLSTNDLFCDRITYGINYAHVADIGITPDSVRFGYKSAQPDNSVGFPKRLYELENTVPPAFVFGSSDVDEYFEEDTLIQGLTCDTTGFLFAAGKGITTYDPIDAAIPYEFYLGDLPPDLHCQGDLTFYFGKLYMVAMGNKFVEVNLQNPALSQVVWEFAPDILPIHGLATFKIECDSSVTYAIGKAADYSVLYRIDYENQTLIEICDIPEKVILGAASYSESSIAPCDIMVDLDADNSSGGVENDFVADTSCVPPINIVDEDVTILSEPGALDSITISLLGISDIGMEYLFSPFNIVNGVEVMGSGTNKITLVNEDADLSNGVFEFILQSILYQNDAAIPTNGTREIVIIGYATVYESEPSRSWITLSNEVLQFNYSIDEPDCFGDDNGSLAINPAGGIAPYSVEWFNAATDDSITNLVQGFYSLTLTDAEGCQRADTVELPQPDTLITTIQSPTGTIICNNSGELSASATGGTQPYTYLWNNGVTDPTNSQLSAGNHEVTVTDANGCMDFATFLFVEDTIFVNQQAQLCHGEIFDFNNEMFASDTSLCVTFTAVSGCDSIHCLELQFVDTTYFELLEEICFGDNYDFNGLILATDTMLCQTFATINGCDSIICLNLTVLENSTALMDEFCAGDEYDFNGTTLMEGGIYLDTFIAFNGCDSLIVLDLQMNPIPEINAQIDGNFCLDGAVTIIANPANDYIWSTGETTATIILTEPGDYSATVTNDFNCELIIEENIPESSDLIIYENAQNPPCFGDVFGSILIDSVVGGVAPYLFALNGEPLQMNPAFENLLAGSYELLVEDANGCQATKTVTLSAPLLLTVEASNDETINLGESINLSAATNLSNPTVQWLPIDYLACDTCLTTTAFPPQSIEYQVIVTDENGCSVTDAVEISVNDITGAYAPNVFSPNNDGINDFFTIYADASIESIATLRVFNRWGAVVFERTDMQPNDPKVGWDGFFNGKLMQVGIYAYFAEMQRVDGVREILKGEVLLLK